MSTNFQAFSIVCASWIAIAAIAWGFYFGFRKNENCVEDFSTQKKTSELKYSSNISRSKKSELKTKGDDTVSQKKPCCVSNSPEKEQSTSIVVQQKGDKKPSPCCKSRNKTSPTQSTTVTQCKENNPSDTGCCIKKKSEDKETLTKSVSYNSKRMASYRPTNSEPKPKKKCCPCGGDKNQEEYSVDLTERNSSVSQSSHKILRENTQTLTKSLNPSLKYDFNHVKNASPSSVIYTKPGIKQEIKEVESMQKDDETKVMRPMPTYSTQLQKEKADLVTSQKPYSQSLNQSTERQYQPTRPNYILVQPLTRLDPYYEKKGERRTGYCCTSVPKEKQGNIRPIIAGYTVEGNLKVKGQKQKEEISIPEDSYEVIRR